MDKVKMIEIRDLLYKMTLIGFIFFFAGMIFIAALPGFMAWWGMLLFGVRDIATEALILMGVFEIFILTLFFFPALAIHWQYCDCKNKKKNKSKNKRKK